MGCRNNATHPAGQSSTWEDWEHMGKILKNSISFQAHFAVGHFRNSLSQISFKWFSGSKEIHF
jgi:hypothetical protein